MIMGSRSSLLTQAADPFAPLPPQIPFIFPMEMVHKLDESGWVAPQVLMSTLLNMVDDGTRAALRPWMPRRYLYPLIATGIVSKL